MSPAGTARSNLVNEGSEKERKVGLESRRQPTRQRRSLHDQVRGHELLADRAQELLLPLHPPKVSVLVPGAHDLSAVSPSR